MEHGVPGTRHPGVGRGRQAGGRRAAAIPVAAGLGAHQPNRRLRLAAEPQTGRREVSALTDARKTLAYDFFRILRAPLYLLNYIDDEDYRRRILTQLNRGEGRHAVARAICYGQRGEIRKRYR
ncbi:transposase, partial [Escherichia coli]|nr:transposase [Escherichia coli]